MGTYNSKRVKTVFMCICCALLIITLAAGTGFGQELSQQEKQAIAQEAQQWKILATSPGVEVLSQYHKSPGKILPKGDDPLDVAYNWLADQGLEEGRNFYKGKLLYISTGSAVVNATPQEPDFIDSRYLAFQRAELEAKAKTAIFLGVDLSTSRGSMEKEINPQERAELESIMKASPALQKNTRLTGVADTVYGLFEKARILAEAKLDKAIEETGTDVSEKKRALKKKKFDARAQREKISRLRNISGASMKAAASAFAEVQGAQIIQSFEGSYHKNYRIVVITLWSHNLQRLVDSMENGTAPLGLRKARTKEEIIRQLPKDPEEMTCLTGVRAYINQNGEHVLLAFGQAGVEVLGGREDKAFELAGRKARLRAMAAVRKFMGEKVAFLSTEELLEVLALYTGKTQGDGGEQEYRSISRFQEKIQAVAKKQKVTGLYGVLTKELAHPFTDRPMVFKVMAWSPSSQAAAQELKRAIKYGAGRKALPKAAGKTQEQVPERKGIISSGSGADKDAW